MELLIGAYLKYRNEKVIDKAYLEGVKMCLSYTQEPENKKRIEDMIKYFENLKKSKYINWHIFSYFRFLMGKNLIKKMIKEISIFHFPILGYLIYVI